MSKHSVLWTFFVIMILAGCSDVRSPLSLSPTGMTPPPPPPPAPPPVAPADVSGTFFSKIANNAVNCGMGEFVDAQAFVVTQNVNEISLLTSIGTEFSGTVSGDIVEWTGSYDERGGTTTFTSLSVTVSGNSASGTAAWTWTDSIDSCNGTMDISLSRDWGIDESLRNSRPDTADPIDVTDGTAFIIGSANTPDDKDYFEFVLTTDATIQVELSHFDLTANNLDLEILDEDLNQLAVSNSVDSFEMVEAQLQAGVTYYIGMLPVIASDTPSYYLSIDLN